MTLVELIVVLAIVAIITAIAVPGVARLGAFSNDEVPRAAREIFQMLRAARVYAATYNVDTAVVYTMDNWIPPNTLGSPAGGTPINVAIPGNEITLDSATGQTIRYITGAAVMYALPGSEELFLEELTAIIPTDRRDAFVPLPGSEGNWKALDEDVAVLVNAPDNFTPVYNSPLSRYDIDADSVGVNDPNAARGFSYLGMFAGLPVILDFDELIDLKNSSTGAPLNQRLTQFDRFPAHVFGPDGRLKPTGSAPRERYTFLVGPRPNLPLEVRLIDSNLDAPRFRGSNGDQLYFRDNAGNNNFRAVPIELYRSTGRVKIAS